MRSRAKLALDDPARLAAAWRFIAGAVAILSLWQGFGYAVGGAGFTTSPGWKPLLSLEGSLRVHGVIMAALGFVLAVQLRGDYTRGMAFALRALRTYSLVVMCCWFGSWVQVGISWGAPSWWALLATLTVWLTWLGPVMMRDGR